MDDLRLANLSLLSAEPASPVAALPQSATAAGGGSEPVPSMPAATAAKDAQLAATMRDMRCAPRSVQTTIKRAAARVDNLLSLCAVRSIRDCQPVRIDPAIVR